jgi:hypothetical protein
MGGGKGKKVNHKWREWTERGETWRECEYCQVRQREWYRTAAGRRRWFPALRSKVCQKNPAAIAKK